jgi:amino acid transporter
MYSFLGIESATVMADNVDQPSRTIPRAAVIGTMVTAAVYICSTIGVMGALPPAMLAASAAPYADAAVATNAAERSTWPAVGIVGPIMRIPSCDRVGGGPLRARGRPRDAQPPLRPRERQ